MEGALSCSRCGSQDQRALRRLKLEYVTTMPISEQVTCVYCLRLYVVTERSAFEALLQGSEEIIG